MFTVGFGCKTFSGELLCIFVCLLLCWVSSGLVRKFDSDLACVLSGRVITHWLIYDFWDPLLITVINFVTATNTIGLRFCFQNLGLSGCSGDCSLRPPVCCVAENTVVICNNAASFGLLPTVFWRFMFENFVVLFLPHYLFSMILHSGPWLIRMRYYVFKLGRWE